MCGDVIVKLIGQPMILDITNHTTKPFANIVKITEMKDDRASLSNYLIDNFNNDFYSVPFNEVLYKWNNRKILIHTFLMELSIELRKCTKNCVQICLGMQPSWC